jgi:hypothetical protein
LLEKLKIDIKGLKALSMNSQIGAVIKAMRSLNLIAITLGVISQTITMNKAVLTVAIIIPHLYPNKDTHKAVTSAEIAIFTKLLNTNIAAKNLSIFWISRWTLSLFLTFWEIIWRRRILLKLIIAVSVAEIRKDRQAKTNKIAVKEGMDRNFSTPDVTMTTFL